MTERELLESVARARHALALASWGVARAAMLAEEQERPGSIPSGEDPLSNALDDWRKARSALGKARARWKRAGTRSERRPIPN